MVDLVQNFLETFVSDLFTALKKTDQPAVDIATSHDLEV